MGELYELYEHQARDYKLLQQSFRECKKRPLLYAATGYGKTVVAAHIVSNALERNKRVRFVAPYISLINQTARSLMNQGISKPGILQADHPWTDYSKPFQIASVQTMARRECPETDLIIIDECHIQYKAVTEIMENTDTPIIGLSGTPFTKGLGKYYNNLVGETSMKWLMDNDFLAKYDVFSQNEPDLSNIDDVAGEFHEGQLSKCMTNPKIVGCAVDTWMKFADYRQTVTFCVDVAHAEFVSSEFTKAGISNAVITGKTDRDERERILNLFEERKINMLVNVFCLVAGFDSYVECMLDLAPTKSRVRHVQKCGRNMRVNEGKGRALFLDNAGNFLRPGLGFPENITIDKLCTGEKKEIEREKKEQEKKSKENAPEKCSSCGHLKQAGEFKCSKCGFVAKFLQNVETEEGELVALKGKAEKKASMEDRQKFYAELRGYQRKMKIDKGKDISDGWLSHTYKDKFGVWPKNMNSLTLEPSAAVMGFIKHKQIKYAKSRKCT